MDSQIQQIFTALGAWQFVMHEISARPVYTPSLDNLPNSVDAMRTPMRLVMPALNRAEGTIIPITLDGASKILWTIDDLLLYALAPQIFMIGNAAMPLVLYMRDYAKKLNANRKLGLTQVVIEHTENFAAGVYEYPYGSGVRYFGVLATHKIKETLNE